MNALPLKLSSISLAILLATIAGTAPAAGAPWRADQLMLPQQLASALSAPPGKRPLVLHVGFAVLYRGSAIPGSRAVGPASRPEGIQELKRVARGIPRDTPVVLYCGCCPWSHCPNVAPAFRTMRAMGFKNVKLLYVASNMQKDWVDRGFPVAGGR